MTKSASRYGVPRRSPRRVVGLMSGTSADGIDAAIVDFSPRGKPTLAAFKTYRYSSAVRRRVLDMSHSASVSLDELVRLDFLLGELLADAVIALAEEASIELASIDLIGSHGHTVRHLPKIAKFCGRDIRGTMQIGQVAVIAERTGVTTVSDFRPRDIAAGGLGAPLVPLTDWILFGDRRKTRAVQNIGGIANVTFLPAGAGPEAVIAFDTGPGNMIIDQLTASITNGRKRFDRGGKIGASGSVCRKTVAILMKNAYFRRKPPKTTGRELFGRDFTDKLLLQARSAGLSGPDIIATATDFTAASIADAYASHLPTRPDEVILCGGGARNPLLVSSLKQRMAGVKVATIDEFDINADAKEAISFAMLARLTVLGQAGNAPSATGALSPAILGNITPAPRKQK